MKKFNVGDKVKIIQRKRSNDSGTEKGWNEPNGNVGEIGYVKDIGSDSYNICRTKNKEGYFGWFDEDDLELVSEEVSTTPYVEGKWYGCKDWRNKHDYVKLDYIYSDKTRIYFTECIDDTEYRQINDWWGIEKKELFEADMSIVSQFLPEGHPDKIGSEKFVFPEKWCIRLTEENVYILGKWRTNGILRDKRYVEEGWYLHTPKHGANGYNEPSKDPDYTEITFEQFKQHVLKESPVVETTKEIDMKAIQEEAKKRFPIGCKFINTSGDGPFTLKEDNNTYRIVGTNMINIWAHTSVGNLYENGKWATLVSLSESKEDMFYAGDYIVTLIDEGDCGKVNYCSKQREDSSVLKPEIDTSGHRINGNPAFKITDKSFTKWRYATPEEAAEYERIGKPYDVTTLQKKEESIPEYVECVIKYGGAKIGTIYKTSDKKEASKLFGLTWEKVLIKFKNLGDEFIPSTKEAYEAQFVSKDLTIEEWSPGTYAVGVKGGFGLYSESEKPVGLGKIYTIKQNRGTTIAVKESSFWVYRENLKWFATYEEAETFSKGLITGHITIDSSEKVKPISQLWMGDPIVEERINTPSIKKETFIENVQSVNVMLRTKKKSIKF